MANIPRSAAVVGSGWAGCAAAVELARAGSQVTLYESSRSLGGRARGVELHGHMLDNGQHILLGAYRDTLALMKTVGIDAGTALLNLPLQMRYPPGSGMDFVAPRLPAPLHLAFALLRAKGLAREDKMSLARFSSSARWMDWTLYTDCSVNELLERFDQTPRLIQLMWRPLCLAALNTPPERASAQVFLNVLRDSLGARRKASDMLIPRCDLGTLFPAAAANFVARQGGAIRMGVKVEALAPHGKSWQITSSNHGTEGTTNFDAVVLAAAPQATGLLLARLHGMQELRATLANFTYEPISTCYLQYPAGSALDRPFYALVDDPETGAWGQFVFDRGQLDARQAGLLSVVVSASEAASALDQAALARAIAAQLAGVLDRPELANPTWVQVITEKRATFACTPGLQRPSNDSGMARLALAGDYTASDYPATLEAAVRSGKGAAAMLLDQYQ